MSINAGVVTKDHCTAQCFDPNRLHTAFHGLKFFDLPAVWCLLSYFVAALRRSQRAWLRCNMQMGLGLRQAKLTGHAAVGDALCPAVARSWNGASCTSSIETQDVVALKVGQLLHCKNCERVQGVQENDIRLQDHGHDTTEHVACRLLATNLRRRSWRRP